MNTREELLQGLYYVRQQINQIFNTYEQQRKIVASYRTTQSHISTSGVKNQSKLILTILLIAGLCSYCLVALRTLNSDKIVICAVALIIIYAKKDEKSKIKTVSYISIIVLVIEQWLNIILGGYWIDLGIIIFFAIGALIAILWIVKFKNKKIDDYNLGVNVENAHLEVLYTKNVQQLNTYKNDLYNQTSLWYPRAYYTQDAIAFFIDAVENYRADTVKELVNLYETSEHYRRMESYQRELLRGQQAILANQERLLAGQQQALLELRYANALNMANFALNAKAVDAIDRNTQAINSLKRKR